VVSLVSQLLERLKRDSQIWKDLVTALWVVGGVILAINLITLSSGFTLSLQLGVLGVVVSLAFQSTIKDALAGTLLLARDAYTIGDVVTVQDDIGVVETIGLCLTQIRNSAGQLITLRNGTITTVANASRDWARLDFTLWVDHDTDIKQALATLGEVFHDLQASPDWAAKLIGQPDILGVDRIDPQGILLKIRAQTAPGQQFSVTREYRLRLNQAFKTKGIKPAIPQRELRYRSSNRPLANP
jgi:moderate conductance mechanosensitive channel